MATKRVSAKKRTSKRAATTRKRTRSAAPRVSTTPRPPAGQARGELLSAAAREFAEQGYTGATTASIARRAGVTQPLVHHHFGSKRLLWDAVLVELFTPLREALLTARREAEALPRVERLARLLRAFIQYSGANPELSRIIRTEASAGSEIYAELYDKWLEPMVQLLEHELVAAIADGTVRSSFDAKLLYFALVGASVEPFNNPSTARRAFGLDVRDPRTIRQYADLVVDLFLRGLLTSDARPQD